MRTKLCMAIVIACLATASEAAAQYCSAERIRVRSEGDGVSADFSSVDTSTCALGIETTVHVEASQGVITLVDIYWGGGYHMGDVTPTQTSVVVVLVSVYDRCLDTEVLSVTGLGEADELRVNSNFKTGSLRAAFDGVDDSDRPVPIAIDLVWTGVGPKERTLEHANTGHGVQKFMYTSSGTIRDAVAAGSVIVGGNDETPVPSAQGTIERNAIHNLDVYR